MKSHLEQYYFISQNQLQKSFDHIAIILVLQKNFTGLILCAYLGYYTILPNLS